MLGSGQHAPQGGGVAASPPCRACGQSPLRWRRRLCCSVGVHCWRGEPRRERLCVVRRSRPWRLGRDLDRRLYNDRQQCHPPQCVGRGNDCRLGRRCGLGRDSHRVHSRERLPRGARRHCRRGRLHPVAGGGRGWSRRACGRRRQAR
eukprot:Amastigsp_a345333_28.p3 type:complete len:147 gc:universal Amastigsp_a345333_28:714-274(-)